MPSYVFVGLLLFIFNWLLYADFFLLESWGKSYLESTESHILLSDFRGLSFFFFFSSVKERKAARLSKEAIKQLHSETQRLIRGKTYFFFLYVEGYKY